VIASNKESLIEFAVQGEIFPAIPLRNYWVTWDGKPKMAIGVGGINYNLKVGGKVFGWANGDRAEPGVSTDGTGKDAWIAGYRLYSCIGNEAKVLSGEAKGETGVVIGKHGLRAFQQRGAHHVQIHFEDDALDMLAIGDKILVKAHGVGLKINGYEDVRLLSLSPNLWEKMGVHEKDGKLVVPVVKEIPNFLISQGAGERPSEQGNWSIQTCYPPDIDKFGLNELRFGDIVLLKDVQSDYGRGQYKGGVTIGVVCCGPSDIAGKGIGATNIMSTRSGRITGTIDPEANIANYLGLLKKP
jgi:hypothetical protein